MLAEQEGPRFSDWPPLLKGCSSDVKEILKSHCQLEETIPSLLDKLS